MKPEEIDEALQLLAPIVSHELRNPMAVIKNSSYFIKTKLGNLGVEDEKVVRHLGIIETELTHANNCLEEILLYARMPEAKIADHGLNGIVEAARAAVELPDGVLVETDLSKEDPKISADPELAAKSVMHAIRNAVQAASQDEDADVTVQTAADGSVRVVDTAGGVPEKALERLFEPFNTTKPKGIGLGLAYAKKALERMNATIEHRGGEETVFEIRFKSV
jgi:signal transduction histidine kinase